MSTRISVSLCAALLAASGTLGAQPVQKAQPTTTTFQVLHTFATPQENTQVQAVIARLRTKFTADAAFTNRLDAALTRKSYAGAESLVTTKRRLSWHSSASRRITRSTRLWLTVHPSRSSALVTRR